MVCLAKFGKMTKFGSKNKKKKEFISHMGMLYTILKEILYRFFFPSLKIEDWPLEGKAYCKILDLP